MTLAALFDRDIRIDGNFISLGDAREPERNQRQTEDIFSDKWGQVAEMDSREQLYESQRAWFLELYGFETEQHLAEYLSKRSVILDAGCGLGYKSAWFAELAPNSTVIGIDISEAADIASRNYAGVPNLYFLRGDIAATGIKRGALDVVICDQVIMHTEDPDATFRHLASTIKTRGEFACYVYAKKALPRELLDDHFRLHTHSIPKEQMWEFAAQLTELGKRLSDLNMTFDSPDIPLLGIKGGSYDLQRFIYWNFIKCFWREDWGEEMSTATNFDWYAPSNAKRYSRNEFEELIDSSGLKAVFFHAEEACYSGRFRKMGAND